MSSTLPPEYATVTDGRVVSAMSPSRVRTTVFPAVPVAVDGARPVSDETDSEGASAPPTVQPDGAEPGPDLRTGSEKVTSRVRRSDTSADATMGAMPSAGAVAA